MKAIYDALKAVGFRETYWQFVYPGQIGGLIRSPRNQPVEFHVRFFSEGMIYAELEIGRSVLLHFLGRRYYLNRYITKILSSRLSPAQEQYLQDAMDKYKFRHDRNWLEWGKGVRFMTTRTKNQIKLFSVISDWRFLAFVMITSIVATMVNDIPAIPTIAVLMILVYLISPKRN